MEGLFAGDEDRVLGEGDCFWWLRSPGYYADYAARVNDSGRVYSDGFSVGYSGYAVRPALWLNL